MNKRARTRLIVVVMAIAVIATASYFVLQDSGDAMLTIADVKAGKLAAGERAKVNGVVIGDSWDGSANPMRFEIKDDGTTGPTLAVTYGGAVPSGFGDKTLATVTGVLGADGVFGATEMMTQCPSKYQSQKPMTVDELLADEANVTNVTVRLTGVVVSDPSSGTFQLSPSAGASATVDVRFAGTANGLAQGVTIETAGQLGSDGVFKATGVSVVKQPGNS